MYGFSKACLVCDPDAAWHLTCARVGGERRGGGRWRRPARSAFCSRDALMPQSAYTRVLARQMAADPRGVLVTAMCPGWCATDMSSWKGPRAAAEGEEEVLPAVLRGLGGGLTCGWRHHVTREGPAPMRRLRHGGVLGGYDCIQAPAGRVLWGAISHALLTSDLPCPTDLMGGSAVDNRPRRSLSCVGPSHACM